MPKGKKFNAAEKHFEEKCVEWRHKIKELESTNRILNSKLCHALNELERLRMENENLNQINEELMKLKDMSNDDIQTLIKSRESIDRFSTGITAIINGKF